MAKKLATWRMYVLRAKGEYVGGVRPPDEKSATDNEPVPLCLMCDRPMRLDRVASRFLSHPETYTYRCRSCGGALSFSEDGDD